MMNSRLSMTKCLIYLCLVARKIKWLQTKRLKRIPFRSDRYVQG